MQVDGRNGTAGRRNPGLARSDPPIENHWDYIAEEGYSIVVETLVFFFSSFLLD